MLQLIEGSHPTWDEDVDQEQILAIQKEKSKLRLLNIISNKAMIIFFMYPKH